MITPRALVAGFLVGGLSLTLTGCGGGAPATPDAAMTQMIEGLAADDPSAFWQMLPPSYQKDVRGVVSEFAAKVDPALYDAGMAAAGKLVTVLEQKREFVLGSPMVTSMARMLTGGGDALSSSYGDVVAAFGLLLKSELSTHAGLAKLDIGDLLAGTGRELMSKAHAIAADSEGAEWPKFATAKVELVEAKGDVAEVKVKIGDAEGKSEKMRRIEGQWVMGSVADSWPQMMTEAREKLAAMAPQQAADVQAALAMVRQFDAVLDEVLAADSQAKFDGAVGKLMGAMGGR